MQCELSPKSTDRKAMQVNGFVGRVELVVKMFPLKFQ